MSNFNNYDPDEILPSPRMEVANPIIGLPIDFDFNKTQTPAGMNPSNHSNSSSSPQSTTPTDLCPFDTLDYDFNDNEYQPTPTFDSLGTTFPMNDHFQTNNFELEDEKLQILAQPKAFYRERYSCEIDPTKKRAHRYIRSEDGSNYEHPTIKIPSKWRDPSRKLYIRVTSVTTTEKVPYHCIHPYEIDTQEKDVIKYRDNNSLYFPIDKNEINMGEKSFLISRTKMIQNNLKKYGPFRLFDSNQPDCQRVQNLQDAKQKIAAYELWKSQLVFTIAELQNDNSILMSMPHTSVTSIVMTDEAVAPPIPPTGKPNGTFINGIKCIPQQGNWVGGDEIVIIMPNPIKRKEYTIYFDFGEYGGQQPINEIIHIDTKSLLFRIPPCPILEGDHNLKVSIIIQDNKSFIHSIDFYYLTSIKSTINLCSHCQGNFMNNKRRCEYDNGESLVSQMNQLSIKQKINESHSRISSDENDSQVQKYLYRLKDSLEIFVRKNDPSQLFRRTRVLLSKYTEDPSPLHDAIQHGHIELALALIEQTIDMPSPNRLLENENENGETPLLIAVKLNQWKLIVSILKNRSDFVEQKDKDGNNLFHLLANLDEDKGVETIENISKILPTDIKNLLKEEKNQKNQTPMDIAQSHGNTQCMNLLTLTIDVGKNNDD